MANKAPMTDDQRKRQASPLGLLGFVRWSFLGHCGLVIGISAVAGCIGKPNQANIELRKQNQDLQSQVATLQRERDAARAEVAGLRSKATTVPSLSPDRLAKLFTTTAIELG